MPEDRTRLYEPGFLERLATALERATPALAAVVVLVAVVVGACAEQESAEESAPGVRRVTATVLDTSGPAVADDNAVVPAATVTRAVWSSPDGSVRVGPVHSRRAVAAGQGISVWVDDRGSIVPAPPVGAGPALTGLFWALVGAVAIGMARVTTRRASADARSRAWAREWADVEPALSGRRSGRSG